MKNKKCIASIIMLIIMLAVAQNVSAASEDGNAQTYLTNSNQVRFDVRQGKTTRGYITKGKKGRFYTFLNPKRAKWRTSNGKVASVSKSGIIKAKSKGTATVSMTYGKTRYACKITVETPKISKKSITIKQGQTYRLKMKGTKQKFLWRAADSNASVDSKGKVTGKYTGTTYISARNLYGEEYKCKVTVKSVVDPNAPGGRNNPVSARSGTEFSVKKYDGVRKYGLKLLECKDGGEADSIVQSENRFNEKPSGNERWVLYHFEMRYISGDGESTGADLVNVYDLFNENGSISMSGRARAVLGKNLMQSHSCRLYSGGTGDFWFGVLLPENVKYTTLRVQCGSDKYGNRLERWIRLD